MELWNCREEHASNEIVKLVWCVVFIRRKKNMVVVRQCKHRRKNQKREEHNIVQNNTIFRKRKNGMLNKQQNSLVKRVANKFFKKETSVVNMSVNVMYTQSIVTIYNNNNNCFSNFSVRSKQIYSIIFYILFSAYITPSS